MFPAQVLDLYLAESLGDETFTAWALLPLRTAEPSALKLDAWEALDQLSHKVKRSTGHTHTPIENNTRLHDIDI